jgi:hypothetical protein
MASITSYQGNRFRVFVERHGIRKTRIFDSEAAAGKWGAEMDAMPLKQFAGLCRTPKERYDLAQTALVTSIPMRVLEANAAIPYKHTEILEAVVPCTKASGIYFLVKGAEVVYVGQSIDMLHRIARHRRDGQDFDGYACVECERDRLDELEAQYIAAFAPRRNLSFGRPKN